MAAPSVVFGFFSEAGLYRVKVDVGGKDSKISRVANVNLLETSLEKVSRLFILRVEMLCVTRMEGHDELRDRLFGVLVEE